MYSDFDLKNVFSMQPGVFFPGENSKWRIKFPTYEDLFPGWILRSFKVIYIFIAVSPYNTDEPEQYGDLLRMRNSRIVRAYSNPSKLKMLGPNLGDRST